MVREAKAERNGEVKIPCGSGTGDRACGCSRKPSDHCSGYSMDGVQQLRRVKPRKRKRMCWRVSRIDTYGTEIAGGYVQVSRSPVTGSFSVSAFTREIPHF
nr:hypothetical protein Iba_chr04aCG7060 [Ipomoea batatas]